MTTYRGIFCFMAESFNITVIISAVCGLLLVSGGIFLLWRGVISLEATSQKGALSIEWKKQLKLTTHVPALALFIIGLAFIVAALISSRPKELPSIIVAGEKNPAAIKNLKVEIFAFPVQLNVKNSESGILSGTLALNQLILKVKATAPLYKEEELGPYPLSYLLNGKLDLGTITLTPSGNAATLLNTPPDLSLIEPLPTHITELSGGFGE